MIIPGPIFFQSFVCPFIRVERSWVLRAPSAVFLMCSTFLGVKLFYSSRFAGLLIRSTVRATPFRGFSFSRVLKRRYLYRPIYFFFRRLCPFFTLGLAVRQPDGSRELMPVWAGICEESNFFWTSPSLELSLNSPMRTYILPHVYLYIPVTEYSHIRNIQSLLQVKHQSSRIQFAFPILIFNETILQFYYRHT